MEEGQTQKLFTEGMAILTSQAVSIAIFGAVSLSDGVIIPVDP